MSSSPPRPPRKGRGALSSPKPRYEAEIRIAEDDGWWQEEEPVRLPTTVTDERCRTVISRNSSPDIGFDRSINPYRGCEHGCVYCFARPTHAYLGLSPGLDFETKLFAKPDAAKLLAAELSRPGYRPAPIMLGANTDPYQPVERRRMITRSILEVLSAFNHPVMIATKSALVVRDQDILSSMAERRLVKVSVSVTTLDPALARVMEPRASAPARRLAAIRALSDAGVPTAVMAAPMIPFVNDHELEGILAAAAAAGAARASYVLLRLPLELKELFSEWLEAHFPDRARRVLAQIRNSREGALYTAEWGTRMRGSGAYADILARRFALAARRFALNSDPGQAALDCTRFQVPAADPAQLRLL